MSTIEINFVLSLYNRKEYEKLNFTTSCFIFTDSNNEKQFVMASEERFKIKGKEATGSRIVYKIAYAGKTDIVVQPDWKLDDFQLYVKAENTFLVKITPLDVKITV